MTISDDLKKVNLFFKKTLVKLPDGRRAHNTQIGVFFFRKSEAPKRGESGLSN